MPLNPRPTLADVLDRAIHSKLAQVRVALPGKVLAYDAEAQTVDVQPAVPSVFLDNDKAEVSETPPPVYGVPVSFQRGGGFAMTFPLQEGDPVLLVFCDRSIDGWRKSGEVGHPNSLRRFSMSDAVAIPGAHGDPQKLDEAHAENMVVGRQGGAQIHIKPGGEIHIGQENAADFAALAEKVLGELRKLVNTFNTHSHITTATVSATAVPGIIAPPTAPAAAPQSVAAAKTKVT